jgi:xylulokinase
VYAVSETATSDASGAVAGFADATGRHLPLVCTMNATKVTDTVARLLGVDATGLDDLALSTSSGANGLTLVPYLDGERTPNRPNARGELTGISNDVGREQLARAAYEGVVCGLLEGLDALKATGVPTSGRLFLVGGGSRSRAYRRVLADLSERVVTVPHGDEHVALGACVQSAAVLRGETAEGVIGAWRLGDGEAIEPQPIDAAAIRERYATRREGVS